MSIFFIVIMLASSLAFGIQFTYSSLFKNASNSQSLPSEKVLNYELSPSQQDLAFSKGFTIVKYSSPTNCIDCLQVKSFLESATRKYTPQIYAELIDSKENSLTITSNRGQSNIENITSDKVLDSLCQLMSQPPVDCALRNV